MGHLERALARLGKGLRCVELTSLQTICHLKTLISCEK
jgi:hypothetical protein